MLALSIILLICVHCFAAPQKQNTLPRIIGGEQVDISQVPYQVAILLDGQQNCGGTLISPTKVLTAQHCWIDGARISDYSVRVGSTDWEDGGQEIEITAFDIHDAPKGEIFTSYDIAVITLKSAVNVSNAVPIPVDDADTVHVTGEVATVSGWGITYDPFSPIPPNVTSDKYPLSAINSTVVSCGDGLDTILCLSLNGTGACYGDSGGPAVINGKLAGIVSGGICASYISPGFFTKVSAFREWIKEHADV
ncbi:trypsin 3A1-like [Cylas formicarius]|uniref:trypsin 3A1-like n=1 Tax=Cylas formicarius TaxID=197179 RepID=UPI002958405C|nr:trypsin 3A1-like [Cylas formicarius]